MRLRFVAFAAGCLMMSGVSQGQSIAELRAQAAETRAMLEQAEAAGMDPSLTASLRESLDGIEQSINEMEQEQAQSASEPDSDQATVEPVAEAYKPNLALGSCQGFTETNYRQVALAPGDDQQLRSLCGQAFEYYTMYKRAVDQHHPEAWRTYEAHEKSAAVLNNFYGETRAGPHEGIVPDTRTAADDAADARRKAEAAAAAAQPAPPRPPRAPNEPSGALPQ